MLGRLNNTFFWGEEFNRIWKHNSIFLKTGDIEWKWIKRIEEKKSYWQVHGKLERLTPERAVFEAFLDISDILYLELCQKKEMASVWPDLAYALYYSASCVPLQKNIKGQHTMPLELLPARWKEFFELHKELTNLKIAGKKAKSDEISSIRVPKEKAIEAWQQLCGGDISMVARKVWQNSYPPRSTAHEIAARSGVSIQDFIFWMLVFRSQGFMAEDVVFEERYYYNAGKKFSDNPKLSLELRKLFNQLED